jgi:hypothetical protein
VEMPWSINFGQLPALVSQNKLRLAEIDESVGRILEQKIRFAHLYTDQPYGLGTPSTTLSGDSIINNDQHLVLAEEAAVRSAVLLANGPANEPVLPIGNVGSIAVLGLDLPLRIFTSTDLPPSGAVLRLATHVNTGDRGSSRVNDDPSKSIGPFDGIRSAAAARGISSVVSGNTAAAGASADFIVVVVGLTAGDEGEEYSTDTRGDRSTLSLGNNQEAFVNSVLSLNKPTAILVESGSIVNVPWRSHTNKKQATIWVGYPGQRAGAAFGKLLFGERNFSGKLPMAWPKEGTLPVFKSNTFSTPMGYFFGYREYDRRRAAGQTANLEFPFGHGLSYTQFAYSSLDVPCGEVTENTILDVSFDVSNVGSVEGDEIALLFVAPPPKPQGITGDRPVKELKGFTRVNLKPAGTAGSVRRVTIPLRVQDLRRWEGGQDGGWVIDRGTYTVLVGSSGADAALTLRDTFTIPPI